MCLIKKIVLFLPIFFFGCTSVSRGGEAHVPEAPLSDDAYAPVLEKWHRESHVYDQFQKRIDIHAVLFTDEMRRAFIERWQSLHGNSGSSWEELGSGKLGIFVSSFTPTYSYSKLEDSKLWGIQLSWGTSRKLAPSGIRSLSKKAQFEPYFPFISNWSNEYLMLFDVNTSETDTQQPTVVPTVVQLELKSALASIQLEWK